LKKANELEASVPLVYAYTDNSVLMEFIGGQNQAPQIKEIIFSKQEAQKVLTLIKKSIEIFLQIGFVHGDLSE
jgi:serine/threonine-protein kinase RIO1